jgi:hypothetical protein
VQHRSQGQVTDELWKALLDARMSRSRTLTASPPRLLSALFSACLPACLLGDGRWLGQRSDPPCTQHPNMRGSECLSPNGGHSEGVFLLRGRQPLRFRRLVGGGVIVIAQPLLQGAKPRGWALLGACTGARAMLWREWQ